VVSLAYTLRQTWVQVSGAPRRVSMDALAGEKEESSLSPSLGSQTFRNFLFSTSLSSKPGPLISTKCSLSHSCKWAFLQITPSQAWWLTLSWDQDELLGHPLRLSDFVLELDPGEKDSGQHHLVDGQGNPVGRSLRKMLLTDHSRNWGSVIALPTYGHSGIS
jgi:hypothetical protein